MTLDSRARGLWRRVVDPVGSALARLGMTADAITVAGLVLTGAAAYLVAAGRFTAGGWVLVAGGLSDTFDGAVARARGRASVTGAFFDSVADRVADAVILAALAWAVRGDAVLFALTVTTLGAALITSYIRAKAESLGETCNVGLFERPERAIALMAALVFHRWLLVPVLWLLAAGTVLTVGQRVVHVWRKLARRDAEVAA